MTRRAQKRTRAIIALGAAAGVVACGLPVAAIADEAATPKNIIVLISDGAGYNQFDSARLYNTGQSYQQVAVDPATGSVQHVEGAPSEVYDSFPVQVGQSHYSANGRASYNPEEAWGDFDWVASGATDSAAAATALGTGVKTNNGSIGFDPASEQLLTVGEQALAVDKKVGVVTSVTFNHATPAGFIAHNPDRNDYHGLATEMIDSGIDVIIGAGHPNFTDANTARASHFGAGSWISQDDFSRLTAGETPFSYIESKAQFEQVASGENVPEKLFGLARTAETLQYNRPGLDNSDALPFTDQANADVPSLETATDAALNVLEQDEEGFFLMVEGGAVDWAGHANQTTRLLEEQLDFNSSVAAVNEWVEANSSWDETLVIVTADHETGYLAGPGAGSDTGWTALSGEEGQLPDVSWNSGSHTNALVPLYAKGVGSENLSQHADQWDAARGAYLDNAEVGQTVFDLLGHSEVASDSAIGVEAAVPLTQANGALSLSIDSAERVAFAQDGDALAGALPAVSVTDSRSEVQAQGKGWALAGTASEFVAGNRSFGAEALSWTPAVVSSEAGAAAGSTATLEAPATLAESDRLTRVGTTIVDAAMNLAVPTDAAAGNYGSDITLTLFPKD